MKYGDWKLRDGCEYYPSQNIVLYPSTNSVDEGSLHIESNVRSIVRRITSKNYKLNSSDFRVSANADGNSIKITPGEANIQGYHLIVNTPINITLPHTAYPRPLTVGISLSYDAANNVTGDVVINDSEIGNNEKFSGAYVSFFDECQVMNSSNKILLLARVWINGNEDGKSSHLLKDNERQMPIIDDPENPMHYYSGWYISNTIENDPHNDHAISGDKVEVAVEGVRRTQYDAIQSQDIPNMINIYKYGSMKNEVEVNMTRYTKPQSFTTDLQDYIRFMPDWYTNKFGDCMTGALRFDNLSLDAKQYLDKNNAASYYKDSSGGDLLYGGTESVYISPRSFKYLNNSNILNSDDRNASRIINSLYRDGGTIMTIIPRSYGDGISDEGLCQYSALVAESYGDVGLKIRKSNGSRTVLSMYSDIPEGENYKPGKDNYQYFSIDNYSADSKRASLKLDSGSAFVDSYSGNKIQFISRGGDYNSKLRSAGFQIDPYSISMIYNKDLVNGELLDNPDIHGTINDISQFKLGIGVSYEGYVGYEATNPYIQLGNTLIYSASNTDKSKLTKIGTIRVLNTVKPEYYGNTPLRSSHDESNNCHTIRITPGIYNLNGTFEDYIQVGTSISDDITSDHALTSTISRIIIGKTYGDKTKYGDNISDQTFYEQTYNLSNEQVIFNKMLSPSDGSNWLGVKSNDGSRRYEEICGIYSYGNIGCSSSSLKQWGGSDSKDTGKNPYISSEEWVRFTRFRYDQDNFAMYGGTNQTNDTSKVYGDAYNIEFNTTIKNRRSNQIIWNYIGGAKSQPVTLSYIHDEIGGDSDVNKGTTYPDSSYYDHNMYLHQNPSFGVRDFLRLDGAGLSVHGDVNNPTLSGDKDNEPNSKGVTLMQGRIYAGVYNDYAETYEKADTSELSEEGMVVSLDTATGKYKICDEASSSLVVGVISDNYAFLIGGKSIDTAESHLISVKQVDHFAVGVAGKLFINVCDENIEPGDLLVSSDVKGLATKAVDPKPGTIIGKALSTPYRVDGCIYYRCLMQIMLS